MALDSPPPETTYTARSGVSVSATRRPADPLSSTVEPPRWCLRTLHAMRRLNELGVARKNRKDFLLASASLGPAREVEAGSGCLE
jgi:hypothetical protein